MRVARKPCVLLMCLTAVLIGAPAMAQTLTPAAVGAVAIDGASTPVPPATVSRTEDGRITIRAVRLEQPLALDGALNEEIYRTVPAVTDFVQQFPRGGEPATEDTEVWIFFDDDKVYVSFRCHDSRPDQMVANEMRRDNNNIWQNDNVIAVLDTFHDRRSGYFFQTNPLGGVRDALIIDETTTNYDWNTVWDVKSRRSANGWTTEMAIPFKSLRYKPTSSQVWGFQVMRMVRSKNEQTLLAGVPVTYGGQGYARLSSAATLVGIEASGGSRNLELKPYAISNVTTNRSSGASNDLDGAFGLDAKYGLTSSLTLDFTYNTDFAQVEIDEQQVNLTRFSLFFPEKRDFFLEGQGIFDFAGSGARRAFGGGGDQSPIIFFSRRIGLNGGRPVAIQAGGRLMGRVGRLSMGLLNIQTEDAPEVKALATNFSVVRVKRDVFRRSSIGMILTNRNPSGAGGASNHVYGLDANLSFFENVRINSYYARSASTGLSGDAESYRGQFQYAADRYGFELQRLKVGDAFNPEVGFLPRDDFRRTFALARFSPRPRSIRGVRKVTWEATLDRYVNGADVLETQQENGTFRLELNSSDFVTVDYFRNYEFLAVPFTVAGVVVPAGEHRFHELVASYSLGPQRKVSGWLNVRRGGFYNGDRTQLSYNGRVKLSDQLAVEPRVSVDWVDLPQGSTKVTLLGARPTYTITPRMFVSALVQYNSGTRTLETNARWRWEYEPGSDLFVVYTDGRETSRRGFPELVNRGIAIKLTRFLRF